jgi:hypothetical protein
MMKAVYLLRSIIRSPFHLNSIKNLISCSTENIVSQFFYTVQRNNSFLFQGPYVKHARIVLKMQSFLCIKTSGTCSYHCRLEGKGMILNRDRNLRRAFVNTWTNLGLHKIWGNSWIAKQLVASQRNLSSMQLIIQNTEAMTWFKELCNIWLEWGWGKSRNKVCPRRDSNQSIL